MKKYKSLKQAAFERAINSLGESAAALFVTLGFAAAVILICLAASDLLSFWGAIGDKNSEASVLGNVVIVVAAVLFLAIAYLFSIPMRFGSSWFYIQEARGVSVPSSSFFSPYHSYASFFSALRLYLLADILKLPIIAPLAATGFICITLIYDGNISAPWAALLTAVILIVLLAVFLCFSGGYMLITYIYALNPEKKPLMIIRESKTLMKRDRYSMLWLLGSFTGLMLSCALVFPVIFAVPYIKMSIAAAAAEILDNKREGSSGKKYIKSQPAVMRKE